LIYGSQIINRKDHAAAANALIDACPIPPLGYFGNLKNPKKEDFREDAYDDVWVVTIEDKPVETIEQVKAQERRGIRSILSFSRRVGRCSELATNCRTGFSVNRPSWWFS
jgi:hypothetical protein